MYLDTFQKELINKLLAKGNDAISDEIQELISLQEVNFKYTVDSFGPRNKDEKYFKFIFNFKAKDQSIQFFREYDGFGTEHLTTNVPLPLKKSNQEKNISDSRAEEKEIEDKHKELHEKEFSIQRIFLDELQEKIEKIIHLVEILFENNLVIFFEKDLPNGYEFGASLDDCTYWIDKVDIRSIQDGYTNRLYISLEKFLRTRILILPGLSEFQKNNFYTFDELNRRKELKRLKAQTYVVVLGVFISAIVTLFASLISHPNESDIKTITRSIDELTVKVEELKSDITQRKDNYDTIVSDPFSLFLKQHKDSDNVIE